MSLDSFRQAHDLGLPFVCSRNESSPTAAGPRAKSLEGCPLGALRPAPSGISCLHPSPLSLHALPRPPRNSHRRDARLQNQESQHFVFGTAERYLTFLKFIPKSLGNTSHLSHKTSKLRWLSLFKTKRLHRLL